MDSSAFVKLPLREPEHEALRVELRRWEGYVSSALIRVEAVRTCARYGSDYGAAARAGLDGLALVPVDEDVLDWAAEVEPRELSSLDALHLATALSLGADLGTLLSYDDPLCEAARSFGLPVSSPE